MNEALAAFDLMLAEDAVWLLVQKTGNPAYDFAFDSAFACRRPWSRPDSVTAIARVGAPRDYGALFRELATRGVSLINSPQQHLNGSELPYWYPCLEDVTPRSAWFDEPPEAAMVTDSIGWPVFVKGARQTSRHDPRKCIAHDASEYNRLIAEYRRDSILGWQRCVVREFVELRPVEFEHTVKIQPSFEFRTFWLHKQFVGGGPYWSQFADYSWTDSERDACVALAGEAASRVDCPFLVVDMAQTIDGRWVVIECNDAQESGYAGVSPFALWNAVVRLAPGQNT